MIFRPKIVLSLILLAVAASQVLGDGEGCTVEPPKPILLPQAVKKGTHHFELKPTEPNTAPEAMEDATLPSGIPVSITMGGCVHWGEIYRFEMSIFPTMDCMDWLKNAADQMDEIARASNCPRHDATMRNYFTNEPLNLARTPAASQSPSCLIFPTMEVFR